MSIRVDVLVSVYCGLRTCTSQSTDVPIEIADDHNVDAFHARFTIIDEGPTAKQPFYVFPTVISMWSSVFPHTTKQIAECINNNTHLKWYAMHKQIFQVAGGKSHVVDSIKLFSHGGFEFSQIIEHSFINPLNGRLFHTKTYACFGERVRILYLWELTTDYSWFTRTTFSIKCFALVLHC